MVCLVYLVYFIWSIPFPRGLHHKGRKVQNIKTMHNG